MCTFSNSTNADICEMCEQGRRAEVGQRLDCNNTEVIPKEPKLKHPCSIPSCHTQDPSSDTLCDKCSSEILVPTSIEKIPIIRGPSTQVNHPVMPNSQATKTSTLSIKSDEPSWHCEYCDYPDNLCSSELCILCCEGRRPDHTAAPSLMTPSKSADRKCPKGKGNILLQSPCHHFILSEHREENEIGNMRQ